MGSRTEAPGEAGRPYQSLRRAQAANDTRATILNTAMRLFLENGYGKVTVSDIAREAGVAVPTIYASAGGKSAILAILIDEAIRDPVVDATLAAVRAHHNPRDVVSVTAHGTRADNEYYHDIVQVMKAAAALDASAADIIGRSDNLYRQALAEVARRLADVDALGPDTSQERALDILWFYFGREAWHLLVFDRQWSWDEAEQWLSDQAFTALCGTKPHEPMVESHDA